MKRSCLAIVLAAGEGTRMQSRLPKVLHRIAGRSMLAHVLSEVRAAGADRVVAVVGPDHESICREAKLLDPSVAIVIQKERLGTANAVLAAREHLVEAFDDIIVAFADTPLIHAEIFNRLRAPLEHGASVSVLGFETSFPKGYGRLLLKNGKLEAIREDKDASEEEKKIRLCNAGLMALRGDIALSHLEAIKNDNAKGEFYLSDVVAIARHNGGEVSVVSAEEEDVQGVNDKRQLAAAEAVMQKRLREKALSAGVTMTAPETVYLNCDTQFGKDVEIEPHVYLGPGVVIGDGVVIHAFSHIEGTTIKSGASIGPFARLRPGTIIGDDAKVGNFVEIKKTEIGEGAKVSHLTYLGDAHIGRDVNIGAGTITCNYDGFNKFITVIGDGAFVGSNTSLVAPVSIGKGAYIGSGSVITKSVSEGSLAIARGQQIEKTGWATEFRKKQKK